MAVGHEAAEYRQRCNQEAELEIHRRQATANCTLEEYKRAMDQNLRQSISNKDREIQQLHDEALVRDQRQTAQIQELQNMVHQQAAANQKLQQLLESTLGFHKTFIRFIQRQLIHVILKPQKPHQ